MATCKICSDPLTLTLEPDSDSETESQTQSSSPHIVPDDLLLPCACHFHWQCLLDQAPTIAISLTCPSCNTYLPSTPPGQSSTNPFLPSSSSAQILTTYTNEGGTQQNLDILPVLTEEAFLSSHPEARPARAMHTLASEGDFNGILELMADVDADQEIDMSLIQLMKWTDPLNGGKSALHVAVEAKQEEVFWLLLWLGSGVKTDFFPQEVLSVAEATGLPRRGTVPAEEDLRFVKDEQGRTAGDYCVEAGAQWQRFVEGGLFN
ncbi:hypothetical protein QBC38DRAFT_113540 [Podospora fimiseda]|uniref:RING-type domain-containing protein n=1 Tax=Podospora fimiseda TaxID=252190 RepID=A0AAN7H2T5_9PEZI|nr:hypothetical protein QBC38DRAFT_113540 [Podospora fimiseda]